MRAIVPAYNEAATVAGVVDPLVRSKRFKEVVVVDDGSSDATSEIAARAGARVIRTERNSGKGGAMLYAVKQCCGDDDHVAFFDADLLGLQPAHADRLCDAIDAGYDMVCGLRDKGAVQNVMQLAFSPVITGERVLARWVVDALPLSCWSGYSIETAMNEIVNRHGGRTALLFFRGVSMRTKSEKDGLVQGIKGHIKMTRQIMDTRRALRDSRGASCRRP